MTRVSQGQGPSLTPLKVSQVMACAQAKSNPPSGKVSQVTSELVQASPKNCNHSTLGLQNIGLPRVIKGNKKGLGWDPVVKITRVDLGLALS